MSQSNSFSEQREKVCHAIASLPENSTLDSVSNVLEPIVADWRAKKKSADQEDSENDENTNGVTPIMVACDKAQLSCFQYMERQLSNNQAEAEFRFWGHPLNKASKSSGGNSAIHFSAMSGCAESIDYLCSIMAILQKRQSSTSDKQSQIMLEEENLSFCLLSQTNSHGDTPIMMASAAGHRECLGRWTSQLLKSFQTQHGNGITIEVKSRVKTLFQQQNDSGDTALSLACGHGNYSVVDFLLHNQWDDKSAGDGLVNVTYEDVQKCKTSLDRIGVVFEQLNWDSLSSPLRRDYETRRENVRRCLVMLQVASARSAQANMESLMAEDLNQGVVPSFLQKGRNNKKKKKSKTKLVRNPKPKVLEKSSSEGEGVKNAVKESQKMNGAWGKPAVKNVNVEATVNVKVSGESVTFPGFRTLQDGRVVQPGTNTEDLDTVPLQECKDLFITPGEQRQKSVKEMLRERYRDKDMNDHTIDAVMESLCLDASMLLLSPHGMALQLSPSQLDAVAGILKKQMDAVYEARQIQDRLRSS